MIRTILITGDEGYIGSVLKTQIEKTFYNQLNMLLGFDIKRDIKEDIRVKFNPIYSFDDKLWEPVDLVIHLAGVVGEPNCQLDVNDTYKTNVEGTNKVIEYCKYHNVPLIMASTCSVYGKKKGIVTEKTIPNPIGLYAITKMMNEQKIKDELDNYIICRFGTVYGASLSQRYDLVIPGMTKRAVDEGKVTVFGGKQRRPFISTEELSKTICKLIKEFEKGPQKQIYNCVAFNKSILEIGKEIAKLTGAKLEIKELEIDERDYEVSNEKLSKIYKPKDTMKKEVKQLFKKLKHDNN